MFNIPTNVINERKAIYTATEIHQQPVVWQELLDGIVAERETRQSFVEAIFKKHDQVRVIFTGAGTSAFAGDTLVPELQKHRRKSVSYEAIATTDIVSNPAQYLFKDTATILVSFARSGNSPESVAAVNLGKQIVDDFYQVHITCNKEGQLAKNSKDDEKSLTILTPEKAHDQGFAMTSSFTSMILAAYSLFAGESFAEAGAKNVIALAEKMVGSIGDVVDDILQFDFERIVYLGSGSLGQLAHEGALKMLELSAGQVVAIHETSLGFRHGPKSILNEKSVVVLFISQDPYTRKYDMDILKELAADESGMKVIALTEGADSEVEAFADWTITVNKGEEAVGNDFYLSLLYVIFAQVLALKTSLKLGITPDNPSPDGKVNRVVKGVTIYNFE